MSCIVWFSLQTLTIIDMHMAREVEGTQTHRERRGAGGFGRGQERAGWEAGIRLSMLEKSN